MKNKECTQCQTKIGRNSRSLLCDLHLKAKYYLANREKTLAYFKEYREANREKMRATKKASKDRDPVRHRAIRAAAAQRFCGKFQAGKKLARYRNKEWGLTKDQYLAIVENASCTYCNGSIAGYGHSLDRLDNAKGYVVGNVVPCCGPCNSIRGKYLTPEEMKVAMAAVMKLRSTR